MAQVLLPNGGNMDAQTRYLFNKFMYEDTRDDEESADLNAAAFEEMQNQEPRELFGPDSVDVDSIVLDLQRHAENMRNDPHLQRNLRNLLRQNGSQMLGTLKTVFNKLLEGAKCAWSGICTIFALAVDLCRKTASKIWDISKAVASTVWQATKAVLATIWQVVQTITATVVSFVTPVLETIGGWVVAMGQGICWLLNW